MKTTLLYDCLESILVFEGLPPKLAMREVQIKQIPSMALTLEPGYVCIQIREGMTKNFLLLVSYLVNEGIHTQTNTDRVGKFKITCVF